MELGYYELERRSRWTVLCAHCTPSHEVIDAVVQLDILGIVRLVTAPLPKHG